MTPLVIYCTAAFVGLVAGFVSIALGYKAGKSGDDGFCWVYVIIGICLLVFAADSYEKATKFMEQRQEQEFQQQQRIIDENKMDVDKVQALIHTA